MVANPVLSGRPASSPGYSLTAAPSPGQHAPQGRGPERRTMVDERVLQEWLDRVARGSLDRRAFTRALLVFGLAPMLIAEILRSRGLAHAQTRRDTFTPTRRGGGGDLKLLWWQAPTILNPHLAIG